VLNPSQSSLSGSVELVCS